MPDFGLILEPGLYWTHRSIIGTNGPISMNTEFNDWNGILAGNEILWRTSHVSIRLHFAIKLLKTEIRERVLKNEKCQFYFSILLHDSNAINKYVKFEKNGWISKQQADACLEFFYCTFFLQSLDTSTIPHRW